jgi:nucleolar protein 4
MGTADNESAVAQHADAIAQRRTLFVRSLPYTVTSDTLSSTFSFVAPIKHATVVINPANKQSRGFGFVTFADAEDAQRAVKEMDGKEVEGRKIKVELAEPRSRKEGGSENKEALPTVIPERIKKQQEEAAAGELKKRSPRLIVRNLPWSVKTPEQLLKYFMPHGKVKDIIIPKKKTGEMSGFAFITMKGYKNATSAMEAVNGVEIEGRTVAVDWAVEKSEWESKREAEKPAKPDAEEEEDDDEEDDEEEGDEDEEGGEEGDEDEEDDEEGDEDEDEMDEDDDEDMDSEDEAPPTDTETTLFIRNLPYSATDDSVYQHFTKFGPVHYARIVMDHSTGRPKGTGFIRFYSADIARDCLRGAPKATTGPESTHSLLQSEALDPEGLYTLDGRILALSRAVEKSRAEELTSTNAKEREKGNNDKRRLYLVNEGAIPLTIPLPPSERLLRDQSRDQRKKLLQADPNLHLSLTRLSIRNLPRWVTSKDLKHFARKAIPGFAEDLKAGKRAPLSREELQRDGGEGKAAEEARRAKGVGVVKQAKVQLEKAGGRSRGYGFIEYWSHRYALMGLRYMNGQMVPGVAPQEEKEELWGKGDAKGKGKPAKNQPPRRPTGEQEKGKRMIVEFAIENAKVVKRRQENEQKSREIGAKRKEQGLKPNERPAKEGDKKGGPLKKGKKTTGGQKERKKEFGKKRKREDEGAEEGANKKNKNWNKKTEKVVKEVAVGGPTPKKVPMDEKTLEIIRKKRMARRGKQGGK